ncbi:MAG: SDR family oxidoreductase [Polyangia bacterium]
MGKTFVTGGTGHVGANLVRALLERGEAVKALVRNKGDRALRGLDLEEVVGDLHDEAGIARAMAGCDHVYHLAAFVSLRAGARREIFDVNVRGTQHVMSACLAKGVQRVVFCSSFGAVGRAPDGGVSDETCALDPFDTDLDYDLSKSMAELEVHRAYASGLDAVIVNPSGIVGPWDVKPSSLGKTIIDFSERRIPAYIPGSFELVAMRDVVAGHLLAMKHGRAGQRYILSGRLCTVDELLDELERLTGKARPRLRVPPSMMMPVAHLSSAFMRSFFPRTPPRFTPGTIKLLGRGKRASTEKAQRELGYRPTSVFAALGEQYDWFRERRIIR